MHNCVYPAIRGEHREGDIVTILGDGYQWVNGYLNSDNPTEYAAGLSPEEKQFISAYRDFMVGMLTNAHNPSPDALTVPVFREVTRDGVITDDELEFLFNKSLYTGETTNERISKLPEQMQVDFRLLIGGTVSGIIDANPEGEKRYDSKEISPFYTDEMKALLQSKSIFEESTYSAQQDFETSIVLMDMSCGPISEAPKHLPVCTADNEVAR